MPQSSLDIDLGGEQVFSNYIFAVSRNSANNVSGGMIWSQCTYHKGEGKYVSCILYRHALKLFYWNKLW